MAGERRRQRFPLMNACAAAIGLAGASSALVGISGWFISAAALAGGGAATLAFNYMLPSATIRLLAILRTACRYGERLEGHRAALGALANIRPALFAGLAAAPPAAALALSTGEASARLIQDVDAVETLFIRLSGRWGAATALVVGVALTGLAGWPCAAATGAMFVLATTAAWALARRTTSASGRDLQRASGRLKDAYATMYAAAPEIVAYGLQSWAAEQIEIESRSLAKARLAAHRAEGWQACLSAMMAAGAAVIVLLLAYHAPLPLACLAALAAGATLEGGAGLVRGFLQDEAVGEAARRIDPVLASAPLQDGPPPVARPVLMIRSAGGASLTLAPGERLAVVGRSGCGKTTLLERFLRLRDVERGQLSIGGTDVADLAAASARRFFAYAPQQAMLLSGSLRDNLRLGAPEASEPALWSALFDAALDRRVRALPDGLDSMVGEGAERLSGGERRRLALARALLKPAPWLLLDEPTEGLDPHTEALVIERLNHRMRLTGQGLILVSHRAAALGLCVRVLTLEDGGLSRRAA
ncbi:MAG: ATP-binding cassette domain-containing protein [Caulobacteraceae bacterium]